MEQEPDLKILFEEQPNVRELVQRIGRIKNTPIIPDETLLFIDEITKDYSMCQDEQNDIQQSYYDDFAKYLDRIDPILLRNTLAGVIMQIGKIFVYSKVEGNYRAEEVKEALYLLRDAGIIILVQMSACNFRTWHYPEIRSLNANIVCGQRGNI